MVASNPRMTVPPASTLQLHQEHKECFGRAHYSSDSPQSLQDLVELGFQYQLFPSRAIACGAVQLAP
jgi:hypothetical protein